VLRSNSENAYWRASGTSLATVPSAHVSQPSTAYQLPPGNTADPVALPPELCSVIPGSAAAGDCAEPITAGPWTTGGASMPVRNRRMFATSVCAWLRLGAPAVAGSTIVANGEELLRLAHTWPDPPNVMLQEYIPPESSEDWIVQAYSAQDGTIAPLFTGVKLRSWPVQGGITVEGRAVANPELERLSRRIFDELGYRGVSDLDWRFDHRDGVYKLLDFNPRVGAQFRLFETDAGIDVVRALHLDLTGRPVPGGTPVEGRRFVCEQLYLPGRLSRARSASTPRAMQGGADGPLELAWLALDDPLPVAAMVARFAGPALRRLASLLLRPRKGREAAGSRRGVRQASRPIVTRRAVKPVPHTNRNTGPNDGAAARPVKNSPGTDDSKRAERRGADPTRSM